MPDERILLLLDKYRSRRLTGDEHAELQQWLRQSDDNRQWMLRFMRCYKQEERWRALCTTDPDEAWERISRRREQRRHRRFVVQRIAAAAVVLVVAVAGYFIWQPSAEPDARLSLTELFPQKPCHTPMLTLADGRTVSVTSDSLCNIYDNGGLRSGTVTAEALDYSTADARTAPQTYHTLSVPEGQTLSLILSDGTNVWLNSGSRLRYPVRFSGTRRVELTGEAYFDVTHTGEPFEVEASRRTIRVLGTQFNVSAYAASSLCATLVEGRIEVRSGAEKAVLEPGQQAEVSDASPQIAVKEVNTALYTSWTTGVLEFRNTTLEDLLTQFSLWYGVEVRYTSPALKRIRLGGTLFKNRPLGYSLDMLERVSDVRFTKEGETLVVSAK